MRKVKKKKHLHFFYRATHSSEDKNNALIFLISCRTNAIMSYKCVQCGKNAQKCTEKGMQIIPVVEMKPNE